MQASTGMARLMTHDVTPNDNSLCHLRFVLHARNVRCVEYVSG